MNVAGIINWLVSTALAAVVAFLMATFAVGLPTKASVSAGIAAAVAAAVSHLRETPFGGPTIPKP